MQYYHTPYKENIILKVMAFFELVAEYHEWVLLLKGILRFNRV